MGPSKKLAKGYQRCRPNAKPYQDIKTHKPAQNSGTVVYDSASPCSNDSLVFLLGFDVYFRPAMILFAHSWAASILAFTYAQNLFMAS